MKFEKLMFRHDDAVRLKSADKAIILEFIRWSCHYKEAEEEPNLKYYIDGKWWMQDSYVAWNNRMPWLSPKTIQRYLLDLFESGHIDKRVIGKSTGGRSPNFYRVIEQDEVKGQNDPLGLKAKLTLVEGQNDQGLKDNLTFSFISTKNQSKNQTKESPQNFSTWPDSDEMAELFSELTKVPACRKSFHREKYRKWLIELMKEENADLTKLIESAKEWQKYRNTPGAEPVSNVLASFGNWVRKRFVVGKNQNGGFKTKQPAQRMGQKGYDWDSDFISKLTAPPDPNN